MPTMATNQDPACERESKSTKSNKSTKSTKSSDKSVAISVVPNVDSVVPAQDSDPLAASAEGVAPFKDLLYVPPDITIDSFAPPRSNHGLIFGAESDATRPLGSKEASISPPGSSANASPNSYIGFKRPIAKPKSSVVSKQLPSDLSNEVDSEKLATDLSGEVVSERSIANLSSSATSEKSAANLNGTVDSQKAAANPSSKVGSPRPTATLPEGPSPKQIRRKKPILQPDFQPATKSSAAPPTLSPSTTETLNPVSGRSFSLPIPARHLLTPVSRVKPSESSDTGTTKRRVRFVAVNQDSPSASAKAAATSDPSGIPQGPSFVDRLRSQLADVPQPFFSESAGAILNYQRDIRYQPVDPQRAAPKKPYKIPSEVRGKRTSFNKCNECEDGDGAYTECEHIDDGPFDITVNEAQLGQRAKPKLVEIRRVEHDPLEILRTYKMLSARNISAFLTENVDKNASKYLMHSLHGTILGYSDSMNIMQARKIAALVGLTWRVKNESLTSQEPKSEATGGRVLPLNTLQVATNHDDGSLRQILIEVDGLWVATCWVKQQVLVSAMVEKDPDPGVEKEQVTEAENVKGGSKEKTTIEDKAAASNDNSNGSVPSGSKEASPNGSKGTSKDTETQDHKPRSTSTHSWMSATTEEFTPSEMDEIMGKNDPPFKMIPHDEEPSRLQILKWKAEGMAIVLKKDLEGFTMPSGSF